MKFKIIFFCGIFLLLSGSPLMSRGIEVSSPPSIPALSGGISFKNSPNDDVNDVAVSNNYLYAALRRYDDNSKKFIGALKIFDASDHAAPLEIASYNVDANLNALFVEGDYLYAAGYSETDDKSFFYIFDISSPAALAVLSSTEFPADFHGANDIKVSGNYAYFVGETGGFGAIDISDVSAPIIKGIYDPGAVFYSIAVFGSNVSLLGSKDVYVLDVSNAATPEVLDSYYLGQDNDRREIYLNGDYLYVPYNDYIRIFDVSNTASIFELNYFVPPDKLGVGDISGFGNYLYMTGQWGSELVVFDISDQTSPVKLGIYNSFSSAPHIFISNGYAFVFGPKSINIIKVSNSVKNVSDNQTDDNTAATPWLLPDSTPDLALAGRMKGKILLQTESKGEAWYIHPKELKRYYLGRPKDAFSVMRSKGYGITNANLAKIPSNTDSFEGDLNLRQKMSGKILLQVEQNGEAWYVNPKNLKRYFLGRPADAFKVMQNLGSGITNDNLSKIPSASNGFATTNGVTYMKKTVRTSRGDFAIDLLIADLSNPKVKILTDTAENYDCKDNCKTKPLKDFAIANQAMAGMNGTYFCPKDYPHCAGEDGSYFWMLYNSRTKNLINLYKNQFNNGPLIVFNNENNWVFYRHTKDFTGIAPFEFQYDTKIQSAISSGPLLVYKSEKVLDEATLDNKQRTVKSFRGGIGLKGTKVYMVLARGATVGDLAVIMKAMNMEYAINSDGGGSSAMYYNGQYKVGPGRNIPNAIVMAER
ncbi:MAG TPA: phosphodiester glycosidase family protein [Patescibacteria group bacterium]|nr:phosphodiester glycosidase family protein [Patescibacteria group bacterium]